MQDRAKDSLFRTLESSLGLVLPPQHAGAFDSWLIIYLGVYPLQGAVCSFKRSVLFCNRWLLSKEVMMGALEGVSSKPEVSD